MPARTTTATIPAEPLPERLAPFALPVRVALLAVIGVLDDPGSELVGHAASEAPSHLWMEWLLERGLKGKGPLFGQTDLIVAEVLWVVPAGWIDAALGLALGAAVGRAAAYNLLVFLQLALAGCSATGLARVLGADRWAASAAGALVVSHPALLGFAADGRLDSIGLGWAGLLAIAWVLAMRERTWRSGLWLGVAGAAVAFAGMNLAMAVALTATLPTLAALALDRARARPLLIGAGLSALGAGLVLGLLLHIEGNDPARLEQDSNPQRRALIAEASTSLLDHWAGARAMHRAPGGQDLWTLAPELAGERATATAARMTTVQSYAPGAWWVYAVAPWLLMLAGLVRAPRRLAPWVLLAAGLQVLGMGYGSAQMPPLVLGDRAFYVAPATLLERLPGLAVFNNYGLFSVLGALAQGAGAALAVTLLPHRRILLGLAGLAWALQVQLGPAPLPLPTVRTAPPEGLLEDLERQPQGPVLLLPVSETRNKLLQTWHGRSTPQRFRAQIDERGQPELISDASGRMRDLLEGGPTSRPVELEPLGLSAVVYRQGLLPADEDLRLQARLDALLGPPAVVGDGYRIWAR